MDELLNEVRIAVVAGDPIESMLLRIKKHHETAVVDSYDDGYSEGYGNGLVDGEFEAGG